MKTYFTQEIKKNILESAQKNLINPECARVDNHKMAQISSVINLYV